MKRVDTESLSVAEKVCAGSFLTDIFAVTLFKNFDT